MKTVRHCALLALFVAVCAALTFADEPGRHPAYLHALTDLRHARAHLENLAPTYHMDKEEQHAIEEIDRAIDEIKRASIDDGKDIGDHAPVDAHMPWKGRLHKSRELIDKAIADCSKEEDDPHTQGLQARILDHLHRAHNHVDEAIAIVEHH